MSKLLTQFLGTGSAVCFLMACSKPTDTDTVSWKISVDGKTVLEKEATNDKVAALNLTLLELRLKIEGACHLGQFIHESSPTYPSQKNSSITSGPNFVPSSSKTLIESSPVIQSMSMHTSGGLNNQHTVKSSNQSFTQLKLTPEVALAVNQKMENHLCTIQKANNQGCNDESRKTSKKIPVDHLQLLAYVQNEFGMKGAAEIVFDRTYLSADKSRKEITSQTVKINKNSFSCDLVDDRIAEPKKSDR